MNRRLMTKEYKNNIYDDVGDNDHVYYNILVTNNGNIPTNSYGEIPVQFVEDRVQAILENPREYHLSIVRFSLPGQSIPIFEFVAQPGPGLPGGNPNPNLGIYSVTLSYMGSFYQVYLNLIPEAIETPPMDWQPSSITQNAGYYAIYEYQDFIELINLAFLGAYQLLKAANPGAPPTSAPFLVFNPETQLISLVADKKYNTQDAGAATIGIFMNDPLFSFFQNFPTVAFNGVNAANGTVFQLTVSNLGNNGNGTWEVPSFPPATFLAIPAWSATTTYSVGAYVISGGNYYISKTNGNIGHMPPDAVNWLAFVVPAAGVSVTAYEMKQSYIALADWNDLSSIVFTTGTIPVKSENIPAQNGSGLQNFRNILTDFQPLINSGPDLFSLIQYFPPGEYRLIDLEGTIPLKKFDIQAFWQDGNQNLFPILLAPGATATLKMLFRKKSFIAGKSYTE